MKTLEDIKIDILKIEWIFTDWCDASKCEKCPFSCIPSQLTSIREDISNIQEDLHDMSGYTGKRGSW